MFVIQHTLKVKDNFNYMAQRQIFMASNKFVFQCPHCKAKSTFTLIHSIRRGRRSYAIQNCDSCDSVIFFTYETDKELPTIMLEISPEFLHNNYKIIDYYPKRSYEAHEAIPLNVAEDYIEALRCFDNNAFKATVVMARRALQTTCNLKGATKSTLEQQVDEIIPEDMKELAHEIRQWGNLGAHPDQIIKDIIDEDAEKIIDFAEMLFKHFFILPYEVQQIKNKRNMKKDSKS